MSTSCCLATVLQTVHGLSRPVAYRALAREATAAVSCNRTALYRLLLKVELLLRTRSSWHLRVWVTRSQSCVKHVAGFCALVSPILQESVGCLCAKNRRTNTNYMSARGTDRRSAVDTRSAYEVFDRVNLWCRSILIHIIIILKLTLTKFNNFIISNVMPCSERLF
jgi:hypothetical protein